MLMHSLNIFMLVICKCLKHTIKIETLIMEQNALEFQDTHTHTYKNSQIMYFVAIHLH